MKLRHKKPYQAHDGEWHESRTFSSGELVVAPVTVPLTTRLDEASASVTYIGKAIIGTLDAGATWQIQKMSVSGSVTSITWADGNQNFDNVWNDRAGLSYS